MTESTIFRVTLPPEARRPFQVLRGLKHHPQPLTFDASHTTALPTLKRRAQIISVDIVREFLRGGPVAEMWLKGAVDGKLDLEKVPVALWEEMNTRVELSTASCGKSLKLGPVEAANLSALGFAVKPEATTNPADSEETTP